MDDTQSPLVQLKDHIFSEILLTIISHLTALSFVLLGIGLKTTQSTLLVDATNVLMSGVPISSAILL